jgi:hypothetical protein
VNAFACSSTIACRNARACTRTHCTRLPALARPFNGTPRAHRAELALGNLTSVTGDVNIFAISSLASVSFPSLATVGGSVLMTVLEQTAVLNSTRFPGLTHVGGNIIVGGLTSHFGTIDTVVLGSTSAELTIDGFVEIGGSAMSVVNAVTVERVVSWQQSPLIFWCAL